MNFTKEFLLQAVLMFWWSYIKAAPSQSKDFEGDTHTRNFSCVGKVIGGYYADVRDKCQTFHVCTLGENSALNDIVIRCLEGTVFDQQTRVCERTEEVDCSISEDYYYLNNELYGPGIIPDSALGLKNHDSDLSLQETINRRQVQPTLALKLSSPSSEFGATDKNSKTTKDHPDETFQESKSMKTEMISNSKFTCKHKKPGTMYADQEAGCKLFHLCYEISRNRLMQATFLCGNGLLFDQATGQCKPAKQVSCSSSQLLYKNGKNLCIDKNYGIGTADPRTKCQFYARTITNYAGEFVHRMPCLCPEGEAFYEKTQQCEPRSKVDCPKTSESTFEKEKGFEHKFIRGKRSIHSGKASANNNEDEIRVKRALVSLASLEQWANENVDNSLFVNMVSMKMTKEDQFDDNTALNPVTRKKRSSNDNETKAEDLNSLINVTSLDPVKDNRTSQGNTNAVTELPDTLITKTDNKTSLVESISEASVQSNRKNEAMVISKNSVHGLNQNNDRKSDKKPTIISITPKINRTVPKPSPPAKPIESISAEPLMNSSQSEVKDADITDIMDEVNNSTISTKSKDVIKVINATDITPSVTSNLSISNNETTVPSSVSTAAFSEVSKSSVATSEVQTEMKKQESEITNPVSPTPSVSTQPNNNSISTTDQTSTLSPAQTSSTSTAQTSSTSPTQELSTEKNLKSKQNETSAVESPTIPSPPSSINMTGSPELMADNGTSINITINSTLPEGPFTAVTLPNTSFTCKGKKLEQFYPDPEANCQAFHYCTPGFQNNQVLDLKFLCKGATKFDLKSQKCVDMNMVTCTVPEPKITVNETATQNATTSPIPESTPASVNVTESSVSPSVNTTTTATTTVTTELTTTSTISSSIQTSAITESTKTPENVTENTSRSDLPLPGNNANLNIELQLKDNSTQVASVDDAVDEGETTIVSTTAITLANGEETTDLIEDEFTNLTITEIPIVDETLSFDSSSGETSDPTITPTWETITDVVTESLPEDKLNSTDIVTTMKVNNNENKVQNQTTLETTTQSGVITFTISSRPES